MAKLLHDAGGFLIICFAGAVAGLLLNQVRTKPLSFTYVPASQRVADPSPGGPIRTIAHVSLTELEGLLRREDVLLLDARPALLYAVGHIPGALSLPKDEFQKAFSALEPRLRAPGIARIVVYCSGEDCEDSAVVAQELSRAGIERLAIFDGGWEEWELRASQPK
jgi:rhodanese-related sulfurtransferase